MDCRRMQYALIVRKYHYYSYLHYLANLRMKKLIKSIKCNQFRYYGNALPLEMRRNIKETINEIPTGNNPHFTKYKINESNGSGFLIRESYILYLTGI